MALPHLMIAGLPWTAWLLWIAAVGLGLGIELLFYFNHRPIGRRAKDTSD